MQNNYFVPFVFSGNIGSSFLNLDLVYSYFGLAIENGEPNTKFNSHNANIGIARYSLAAAIQTSSRE